MKVGLVCPYDLGRPGGVQDQVIRLARWLGDAGHTVRIIAPGTSDHSSHVSVGAATVVPANGAKTPVALGRGVGDRVTSALEGMDVAHVHEPLMPQVSLTAMRRSPVPIVATFHADTTRLGAAVYRFGRGLTKKWFDRASVLTAVSPIASRVVEYTGRVRIIPNGIDVDDYGGGTKVPKSVMFLGRNDERKGLPNLLAAWPIVRAEHPDAALTVVGSSQPEGPAVPGVTFAGRVSEAEKLAHLKRSAIYCAPNLGGESFGIVVAEGMAAGCAIVASGLPAFVRVAGEAGTYVSPGDVPGLASAITKLVADPAAVAVAGTSAQRLVRRFDGSAVAAAYLEAYQEAAG